MLDWLIIGGGIHGTAISHYLVNRRKIPRQNLRVLDPHAEPLALWKRFTANTGMPYLRSPMVHHIHYDPWSARTFSQTRRGKSLLDTIPHYERPSLLFFNAYSDYVLNHYDLRELRLNGCATGLKRLTDGWQVETNNGALIAKNVVLAMGASEQPLIPNWARGHNEVTHMFSPAFDRNTLPERVVIVGGGISAGQLTLTLGADGHEVTLLSRHAFRQAHFDSDPCWVTRLCLADFHNTSDWSARRTMITQARNRGSMPPDVIKRLDDAENAGNITVKIDEVKAVNVSKNTLTLTTTTGTDHHTQHIVLATGFEAHRPGGEWIGNAVYDHGLPTAPDSYPIVDPSLCWTNGIYVSGALAELEVGPVSRNIIGARLAAERIGTVT